MSWQLQDTENKLSKVVQETERSGQSIFWLQIPV